jgi:hypothetical protein
MESTELHRLHRSGILLVFFLLLVSPLVHLVLSAWVLNQPALLLTLLKLATSRLTPTQHTTAMRPVVGDGRRACCVCCHLPLDLASPECRVCFRQPVAVAYQPRSLYHRVVGPPPPHHQAQAHLLPLLPVARPSRISPTAHIMHPITSWHPGWWITAGCRAAGPRRLPQGYRRAE